MYMPYRHILSLAIKIAFISVFFLVACSGAGNHTSTKADSDDSTTTRLEIPVFNQDSAYYFVARQVDFGPRVPNSPAHRQAAQWLASTLQRFADTVIVQNVRVRAFDNTILNLQNIVASFSPEKRARMLICAHWDTRPFADWDPDPANHYKPIPGANDGASGVGVLLEIARLLSENEPRIGVDIVLFDGEDYGKHESLPRTNDDYETWALGSQHWARNPHVKNYNARFGILLDMVGAKDAKFKFERYSLDYAPSLKRKVWATAKRLGFDNFFIAKEGNYVIDDHVFVNNIANIPTINIIHQEMNNSTHGFFRYWHTMKDDMEQIDPNTLGAVGQTVLTVIFEER